MIRCCRDGGSSFSRLRHLPVVLNEIKLFSVSVAGVEVVLLHLRVDLVIVPMIVIETIQRSHHSGAMTSARAVYVKLACSGIVNDLQKLVYLCRAWVLFIDDG